MLIYLIIINTIYKIFFAPLFLKVEYIDDYFFKTNTKFL